MQITQIQHLKLPACFRQITNFLPWVETQTQLHGLVAGDSATQNYASLNGRGTAFQQGRGGAHFSWSRNRRDTGALHWESFHHSLLEGPWSGSLRSLNKSELIAMGGICSGAAYQLLGDRWGEQPSLLHTINQAVQDLYPPPSRGCLPQLIPASLSVMWALNPLLRATCFLDTNCTR